MHRGAPGGRGYGVRLSLEPDLDGVTLSLRAPGHDDQEIGYCSQAGGQPDALRWEELELICRAAALQDPGFVHPGPALLLLSRFVPICRGDDLDWIVPLLESAWGCVGGFSRSEVAAFVEGADARDAGFEWRQGEGTERWLLGREAGARRGRGLYTLRHPENDEFPFATLDALLEAARDTLRAAAGVGVEVARTFADTGDLSLGPGVARALEGDAARSGLARALGDAPDRVRLAWVCEVILGSPPGEVLRRRATRESYPREKHLLLLDLPLQDGARPLAEPVDMLLQDSLVQLLGDRGLGSASAGGAMILASEDDARVTVSQTLTLVLKGDLGPGIALVRECLWWLRAPSSTRLRRLFGDALPLDLDRDPGAVQSRTLELSAVESVFLGPDQGYRFDRPPLSSARRQALQRSLAAAGAQGPDEDGWFALLTTDGGAVRVCLRRLDEDPDLCGASLDVERLTLGAADVVWRLAHDAQLLILPAALATSREVAEQVAGPWPRVRVLDGPHELFEVLAAGPYAWWGSAEPGGAPPRPSE
ncbi:MAG: hypothetical protein R3F62_11705 [Planctomycetota bacterium]